MEFNTMNTSNLKGQCEKETEVERTFRMKTLIENLPSISQELEAQQNSDEEYADALEELLDDIEGEELSKLHQGLSEDELQTLKEEAFALKNKGNSFFKESEYKESIKYYTLALNSCPIQFQNERSVLYGNRAAARIGLDEKDAALLDCNRAIELNPNYMKVIIRRAQLHRKLENLEHSLEDYKKILELDPSNMEARHACATMPQEIEEKNEKLKQEMFGKLKELGNICLKPFGLSTDNFKVVQDPNTGGYSINFQNNPT